MSPEEEERIQRFLADLAIIPLDDTIEDAAIKMRRAARLKLPDAIIAATALSMGATLITGDQKLAALEWPDFWSVVPE